MRPLVSVNIAAYNHELYISQCIDGVLMQKTNFPFEIIVHDDASTDFTQIILKEYESRNPNLFNNIYQTENQHSNKDVSIWADFMFPKAKGKYIALCDGDDYWTDPNKLQIQVDFLEKNDDFAISYHNTNIFVNGSYQEDFFKEKNISQISSYNDLLCFGNYMQTSSIVFLNKLKLFPFEKTIKLNDYVLLVWISQFGKIYRFNENMSVYRLGTGIWSTLDSHKQTLHTINSLYEVIKIVQNDADVIILDNRIKSLSLSLLPIELQKVNINNYSLKEFLSKNIKITVLFLSALNKVMPKLFRFK